MKTPRFGRSVFIYLPVSISRILYFIKSLSTSYKAVVIYLGPRLLDILLGLKRLRPVQCTGIRSCTDVRILPFHFSITTKLFPREFLSFRIGRHCSHLLACTRWELPTTCSLCSVWYTLRTFVFFDWQQRRKQQ